MYPIVKRAARALGYRLKRMDLSNGANVPPTLHQALDNYQYNGSFYPVEKPWNKLEKDVVVKPGDEDFDVITSNIHYKFRFYYREYKVGDLNTYRKSSSR